MIAQLENPISSQAALPTPNTRKAVKQRENSYLFVYLLIGYSFENLFTISPIFKGLLMVLSVYLLIRYKMTLTSNFTTAFLVFTGVLVFQGIFFSFSLQAYISNIFIRLLAPYVIINLLYVDFHKKLVNIIYVLSAIGLGLWVLGNIFPVFHNSIPLISTALHLDPLVSDGFHEQILIFTYEKAKIYGLYRNAGFCHEPGAYAVVLVYALVYNNFINAKKGVVNLKNIVFTVAMLSTFSTAGYISFVFIFIYQVNVAKIAVPVKALLVVGFLYLAYYSYTSLNFMESKISSQMESAKSSSLHTATDGRFMGMRKSLVVLSRYPLFGRGYLTVSKADIEDEEAAGYGMAGYASKVGVPVFIITLVFFYKSMKKYGRRFNVPNQAIVVGYLAFMPVLFAQAFIGSLLFSVIIFYDYLKYRNYA